MKNLPLLFLLLFSLPVWAGSAAAPSVTCTALLSTNERGRAVEGAEQALKNDKDDFDLWLCLGMAREAMGQLDAALSAMQSAEKFAKKPTDRMVALVAQGTALRRAQKPMEAVPLYQKGLDVAQAEKDTGSEQAIHNLLGSALLDGGDATAALEQFQLSLKLAANDNERAESYGRIASAQSKLGQHEDAIAHQLKAVMMEEKAGSFESYAEALLELGRICLVGGQYADAEKWLNKLLKLLEDAGAGDSLVQSRAHAFLSQVKAAQGDDAAAREQQRLADEMHDRILDWWQREWEDRIRQEKSAQ
ncbi:MAG: tetratricopeptide repeat protein [Methylobacillus sp.]|jgi:tetratricopeptide (TPR) repeat protein|nr:tetratricopeptide repeat protein [Methylobacillus sp.]